MLLEESTTEQVPPILEKIVSKVLSQSKTYDTIQKDLFLVLMIVLMIENGFVPVDKHGSELEIQSLDSKLLNEWKLTGGLVEAKFVLDGFNKIVVKLILSPLGSTVLLNLVLQDFDVETYSVCLPISRYVVSPQASTIPLIFRDLKHFSISCKNKILNPVKSEILNHCGYTSASLKGLSLEVITKILLYLPVYNIICVASTCSSLQDLLDNEILWHELCKRDFKSQLINVSCDVIWKEFYREKYIQMQKAKTRRVAGTMHDNMDHSDYVSYIDNPLWDQLII